MADPADRATSPPPSRRQRTEPPRRRRWRHWLARLGLLLLALVLAAGSAAWWALRSADGRVWLTATAVSALNGIDGVTVRLGALSGDLPLSWRLEDLTVADSEGVWLSADRLALAWRPRALLAGRLHVTEVSARALSVVRAPVSPSAEGAPRDHREADGGGLDPRWLSRLRVDRLALEGLHLGSALAGGEPVLVDASGRFGPDGPSALVAMLQARRIDGGRATADISARLHGAALDRLSVDVQASEGAGGRLSSLVGLPGAAGWSVSLTGDGPAADWRGDLSAGAEGLATLRGTLSLDLRQPVAPSGRLQVTATPGPDAPPTWRAALTDRLSLAVAGGLSPDGAVSLSELALETGALALTGAGGLDAGAGALTARLDGALTRPDLLAPLVSLPLESGTLAVSARGAPTGPTVSATLTATAPGAGAVRAEALTLTVTATPDGPLDDPASTVAVDLAGRLDGVRAPAVVADLLPRPLVLEGRAVLAPTAQRLDSARLHVREAAPDGARSALDLTIEAQAALAPALSGSADARLTVTGLGRLAPVLGGLAPTGSGTLALSDVTVGDGGVLAGDVRLALADAGLGLAQVDAVLGPTPSLAGRVRLDPARGLAVDGLTFAGRGATVTGSGAIPPGFDRLQADLTVALPDLAVVAGAGLAGPLTLDAALSGQLGDPDARVTARMPSATLGGLAWRDLTAQVTARGLAGGPSGRLTLTGTGPGGAVDLSTDLALPGYARLSLSDVSVRVPGASLDGAVTTDFASGLSSGQVDLEVADAGRLKGWGLPALAGRLSAGVTLSAGAEGGGQRVALAGRGSGLRLAGTDPGALSWEATLTDALGQRPSLQAALTLSEGGAGALEWSRLALRAEGPLSDLTVRTNLEGTAPAGPLTLSAAARVRAPGLADPARIVLNELSVGIKGHRLTLRQPATVDLRDGLRTDRLALALDDGTLTLAGGLSGAGALDLRVEASDLPLALAALADPGLTLSGRLGVSASLTGALPTPRGDLTLRAREVRLAEGATAPPLSADLSARLEKGRLTGEATVSGFAPTPARASADLPLRLGGGVPVPPDQPLSADLAWSGPVGRVWEMLPLIEHRLTGDMMLDARVAGTLAAPDITADMRLTNGRYEHLGAGTLIDGLSVSARASGSDRLTVSLSGNDGGAGRIAGDGSVTLGADGPVGKITATVENATLVRRDDVTGAADADLTLTLSGESGRLSGIVRTREVRVRLVDGGAADVETLEVTEIDQPGASALAVLNRRAAEDASAPDQGRIHDAAFPVALAIDVDLPNQVYVSGKGLDSEWGGRLLVGGTVARPTVTGAISVRKGVFEAIGKRFNLETGEVRFSGGHPVRPVLDVVALYQASDIEARVGVRGPASDPDIVLESVPALPRDEVMSRILFDKQAGALTTLEGVQLARALASLSGIGEGGGPGLVDGLRQAVGLEVLRVGGQGLEAGTYLGEDVYVGVEQGLSADSGGVSVEVDLGAGFKMESKARRSGQGEVGIMWRKDY